MIKVSYNLRDTKATDTTTIILICRWNGNTFKQSTQISVKPSNWSKPRQNILSGDNQSFRKNSLLRKLKDKIEDFYIEQKENNHIINKDELKVFLKVNEPEENKKLDLLDCLPVFLEHKKLTTKGNQKKLKSQMNNLQKFAKERKIKLSYSNLDAQFLYSYTRYMAEEKQMTNETIQGNIKNIKSFLNWSIENDYSEYQTFKKYKFPYKVRQADSIALTNRELDTLLNMNLDKNERLDRIRDAFCLECYTGLRYSDLIQIKPEMIDGKTIKITTQKTTETIFVPIANEARRILHKYYDKGEQVPFISNQKMNKYLKELGELAGFDAPFHKIALSGNKRIEQTEPRYMQISSHTARRTFVTLAYKKGMKELEIMKITGHSSLDTFRKYAKLNTIDVDESFFKAWDNIDPVVEQIIGKLAEKGVNPETISYACDLKIEKIEEIINKA